MKRIDKTRPLAATRKLSPGAFAAPAFPSPEYQILARSSLWMLLLFLLLSVAAWTVRDSGPAAALPEALVAWLGAPPPLALVDAAFAIYIVSALILLPARLGAPGSYRPWSQLGYRATFYLIYLATTALAERFMFVLVAGIVLYGLEQLCLWGLTLWGGNGQGSEQG